MCANCKCYVSLGQCYYTSDAIVEAETSPSSSSSLLSLSLVLSSLLLFDAAAVTQIYHFIGMATQIGRLYLFPPLRKIQCMLSLFINKYYADHFNVLRGNFITQLSKIPLLNRHVRGGNSNSHKKKHHNIDTITCG